MCACGSGLVLHRESGSTKHIASNMAATLLIHLNTVARSIIIIIIATFKSGDDIRYIT